ncbi:MAG: hypothetical protein PHN26_06395 [Eubacteriaceae bacterium]|nr:hypothetical protein [Eubacteriaceae bacterium]
MNPMFITKEQELCHAYEQFVSSLKTLEINNHDKIKEKIKRLDVDNDTEMLKMKRMSENSKSKINTKLLQCQISYYKSMKNIINEEMIHRTAPSISMIEQQTEASSLYAEYVVDFAKESMRQAVRAALVAADQQMTLNEMK